MILVGKRLYAKPSPSLRKYDASENIHELICLPLLLLFANLISDR
jgi:hypothetical protein